MKEDGNNEDDEVYPFPCACLVELATNVALEEDVSTTRMIVSH